ncbi:MAG: coenzyme F420-0:L-glutamate ligase, partial [Candidatus Kariarchaeaceae archaeon]
IIIIASKIISTVEGCRIKLSDIVDVRDEATHLGKVSKLDSRFVEIVFREADEIIGAVPGAVLALKNGIMQANAGVDNSNSGGSESLITLPKNPILSANKIRKEVEKRLDISIGVIISDSKTHPLRRGTSGFALAVSGFIPVIDDRGTLDLFSREMKITSRAVADNIVCGAEILMGESNQAVPVVIARGYEGIIFQETKDEKKLNEMMKMDPARCIYIGPLWKNRGNIYE